jgi:hypothetical protein
MVSSVAGAVKTVQRREKKKISLRGAEGAEVAETINVE